MLSTKFSFFNYNFSDIYFSILAFADATFRERSSDFVTTFLNLASCKQRGTSWLSIQGFEREIIVIRFSPRSPVPLVCMDPLFGAAWA